MYLTRRAMRPGRVFGFMISVFGAALGIFSVIALMLAITDEEVRKSLLFWIFMALLGFFLFFNYRRNRKKRAVKCTLAKNFNNIFEAEVRRSEEAMPVNKLAAAVGMSRNDTVNRLSELIEDNYLVNIHVDNTVDMVVFAPEEKEKKEDSKTEDDELFEIKVECPSCGAENTVILGRVSKCEYCGTELDLK